MVADGGYVNVEAIEQVQQKVELYVAVGSEDNDYRRHDYRPVDKRTPKKVTERRLLAGERRRQTHLRQARLKRGAGVRHHQERDGILRGEHPARRSLRRWSTLSATNNCCANSDNVRPSRRKSERMLGRPRQA